jgi:PKD repeat protein
MEIGFRDESGSNVLNMFTSNNENPRISINGTDVTEDYWDKGWHRVVATNIDWENKRFDIDIDDGALTETGISFEGSSVYELYLRPRGFDRGDFLIDSIRLGSSGTPTASFSIGTESPGVGESVTFDAGSSSDSDGTIETFEWDFDGDGTFETTGEVTTHTFQEAGTYQVTLRVTDDAGNTATTSKQIEVTNQSPSASFSVSPDDVETGEQVAFDASESTDPDGTIETYEWDFDGDGTFEATGSTVEHTFADSGDYDVTLRVTDDAGQTASTSTSITVSNPAPTAVVEWSPTSPSVGEPVTFDGSNSYDENGTIQDYQWYLTGDRSVAATGSSAEYTYDEAGEYTVSLTVTDDGGRTATTEKQIEVVADEPPTASFQRDRTSPMARQVVEFDASGSADPDGSIQSYEWDFTGDGSVDATGVVAEHVYDSPGTYSVTLTVTDSQDSTGTETVSLAVDPATIPVAIDENNDGFIDEDELSRATQYWKNGTEVPGTGGETVDDATLLDLTQMWRNGTEVGGR